LDLVKWLDELETELNTKAGALCVHIRLTEELESRPLGFLFEFLGYHKGSVRVIIHHDDQYGKRRNLNFRYWVKPTARFFEELSYLIGAENIALAPFDFEFEEEEKANGVDN